MLIINLNQLLNEVKILLYPVYFFCLKQITCLSTVTPQTYWINTGTLSETIVANVNLNFPVVYFAKKTGVNRRIQTSLIISGLLPSGTETAYW